MTAASLSELRFSGVGLHTGEACAVRIRLGGEDLRFVTPSGIVRLTGAEIRSAELCTTVVSDGASVSTVEHLLSALAGSGHFAAEITVEGPELPILDGSALPYVQALPPVSGAVEAIVLDRPIELAVGRASLRAEPASSLSVDYTIEFDTQAIGRQRLEYRQAPDSYRQQIAPARTFALERDVDAMRQRGLIRGGSMDCALVFGPDAPLNPPLRFADEPVRHKILDLIGDLALLGRPLHAHLTVERGGHALHAALVREIQHRLEARSGASLTAAKVPARTQ